MSENESQVQGKTIKDLTDTVKEMASHIYNFPSEVKILETKLVLYPFDGYWVHIKYEIDDVQYESKRKVYSNLHDTVDDMLFSIKDFYERTHVI
jgi:hypothetical protein